VVDHAGDPGPFTNATIIVGEGSREMCEPGYPEDPHATVSSNLLPKDRTRFESTHTWGPLGPFPRAIDFFGDGSIYVIDAQGHCPGHINVLLRTSPDGGWLYLAGDSAHDGRLLTGEAQMALKTDESGRVSARMHKDKDMAEAHIRCISELAADVRVRVLIAHDREWYEANKDGEAFWPGTIATL
jgi:glyoxylase-like metal-dependent hydrolase (beta-lactamase superfamily II)